MATIRDIKKTINYELSEVIEQCYVWQFANPEKAEKAEKIIDLAIESFDSLIERVNTRNVDNLKSHFQDIIKDLKKSIDGLMKKLVKL